MSYSLIEFAEYCYCYLNDRYHLESEIMKTYTFVLLFFNKRNFEKFVENANADIVANFSRVFHSETL